MPARVGLATGKEYLLDGSIDEVFKSLMAGPHTLLTVRIEGEERRVYVFQAHVAYVEEEKSSMHEDRDR